MGERALLAVGLALTAALAPLPAQGPIYRERWGHCFLERRRAELWRGLEGRDAATCAKVSTVLAEGSGGSPFVPVAKALALIRGVPADPAFVLRTTVGVFPLPEVCDPEGDNEVCRQLNASVFLPFTVDAPGKLAFDVEVVDRAGAVRFRTRLTEDTSVPDLRMARPVARVPAAELADGSYELVVRTLIDGAEPRAQDPSLRVPVHVLRGYQARAEAARAKSSRCQASAASQLEKTLVAGLAAEVDRCYHGEAFDSTSDAVADLLRLEQALDHCEHGRHPLTGLVGDVPTAVPVGNEGFPCVLRIAPGRNPADRPDSRPLVVVAGGAPAYDVSGGRPAAPAQRGPRWLAAELAGFGADRPWDVAFLGSPGGGRSYADDLRRALRSLRELWRTGDRPIVLVCDREAASVVGLHADRLETPLAGIVLVGAGAMPAPVLERLGSTVVRLAPLAGYPSSDGLRRVLEFVAQRKATGEWHGDVAALPGEAPSWPFGLPAYSRAITDFVAGVLAR